MKGTESMLAPSTGELCYRGRHIFMDYMYMPDKTTETISTLAMSLSLTMTWTRTSFALKIS